ncbi:MAG: hypothetical protein HGA50_16005, partial [Deltaproteobacteria bacterium]|nr:hypothetical protein [Deltaproteobacteria bacterium]
NDGDESSVTILNPGPGFASVTLTRGLGLQPALLLDGFQLIVGHGGRTYGEVIRDPGESVG